jgi:hypothetical protein
MWAFTACAAPGASPLRRAPTRSAVHRRVCVQRRINECKSASDADFDMIETLYNVGYRIKEFCEAPKPTAQRLARNGARPVSRLLQATIWHSRELHKNVGLRQSTGRGKTALHLYFGTNGFDENLPLCVQGRW